MEYLLRELKIAIPKWKSLKLNDSARSNDQKYLFETYRNVIKVKRKYLLAVIIAKEDLNIY